MKTHPFPRSALLGTWILLATPTFATPIQGNGLPGDHPALAGATVINFESFAEGFYGPPLAMNGVTANGTGDAFYVTDDFAGQFNVTGSALAIRNQSPQSLTLDFSSPVDAFGFNLGGTNQIWQLSAFSTSGGLLDTTPLPVNDPANDGYWSGIQAQGIASVSLVNTAWEASPVPANSDYIVLDNLSYRPSPPPPTEETEDNGSPADSNQVTTAGFSGTLEPHAAKVVDPDLLIQSATEIKLLASTPSDQLLQPGQVKTVGQILVHDDVWQDASGWLLIEPDNDPNDVNSASGNTPPDLILGAYDQAGNLVASNGSDQNPWGSDFLLGDNLATGPDHYLQVRATGADDLGFTGAHGEEGFFRLEISALIGADRGAALVDDPNFDPFTAPGDLDFVTFTDLSPGKAFRLDGDFTPFFGPDSALVGLFDDLGQLGAASEFSNGSNPSLLTGVVPGSGRLTLGVTGYGDAAFTGAHQVQGLYNLNLATFGLKDPDSPLTAQQIAALNPILTPDGTPLPGLDPNAFSFGNLEIQDGQILNLDPLVAIGYDYLVQGGSVFDSVLLPTIGSDGSFTLCYFDDSGIERCTPLSAGVVFDFSDQGIDVVAGVTHFIVRDIDVAAAASPSDPGFDTAFVTTVQMLGTSTSDVVMTPLTCDDDPNAANSCFAPSSVPEPGSLLLLGLGGLLLGRSRWNRRR